MNANEKAVSQLGNLEKLKGNFEPSLLNGTLFKVGDGVYFIMNGKACLIPNASTFLAVFTAWDAAISHPAICNFLNQEVPKGENFTDGAMLIKTKNSEAVYLLTHNKRHGITSMAVIAYCSFARERIQVIDQILMDSIPAGFNIDYQ